MRRAGRKRLLRRLYIAAVDGAVTCVMYVAAAICAVNDRISPPSQT